MNSLEGFIALIRDEIGVPVTIEDAGRALHDLPGWHSICLVFLVAVLEDRLGRRLSVIDLLEAPNLESIYEVATTG